MIGIVIGSNTMLSDYIIIQVMLGKNLSEHRTSSRIRDGK
jgi:hypothetical protein